ncbi:Membrane-bound lytic murein transglycosylase C precursor [compost metagenome]
MNIDPRVMKELLKLQILSKTTLIKGDSSETEDSSIDFDELLQTVMGQTAATNYEGMGLTASSLNGVGNSVIPSSLSALNKSYTPLKTLGTSKETDYNGLIEQASARFGVDSGLVKAVIHQESSFNPNAVSTSGAKGLMQLMDQTGSGLGVTNPFDPVQNVRAGTQFLSNLLSKYEGNEGVALAAYNAGPGRVDRLGIRNDLDLQQKLHLLPKETQAYVGKVLGLKLSYQE